MVSNRSRRLTLALGLLTCVGMACTGTPPHQVGQGVPVIGESPVPGATGETPLAAGEPAAVTSDPAAAAAGTATTGVPGGAGAVSTTDGSTTTSSTTTGGTTTGSTGSTSGTTTGGSTDGGTTGGTGDGGSTGASGGSSTGGDQQQQGPPEAKLYDDRGKTVGISDDRIHLCGHAALTFADAFDTRPADLNVYWEMVNEAGGVHGRKVTLSWKDDGYDPARAVQAAEQCKSEDPFLLLGGIGFDQIPAVRNWAEQNQMLYVHHIANAPDRTYNFSFSAQPTVDRTGTAFGEYIATTYPSKRIGIIWRQSENWEPGHRGGEAELKKRGAKIVADLPVQRNQSVYNQQIAELRAQNAEVVWVWENALGAAQIIQQAESQGYRPKWVVFPFQTTLDVVGTGAQPIDGVATWPAYTRGGYGIADNGYQAEIERFEAAYAKKRPNTKTNDILWQVWLGNKAMHDWLLRCGQDCNRNRFAGLLLSGYKQIVQPNCVMDFTHRGSFGGHIGGHQFLVHQAFQSRNGPAYRTTRWCSEHLD